ncbi:unnamed protein product, partial [Closterium sp. Naga37s-1]
FGADGDTFEFGADGDTFEFGADGDTFEFGADGDTFEFGADGDTFEFGADGDTFEFGADGDTFEFGADGDTFEFGADGDTFEFGADGDTFEFGATVSVRQGKEVSTSYGLRGNEDLLEAYGFVLPGNMLDHAPLLPSPSPSPFGADGTTFEFGATTEVKRGEEVSTSYGLRGNEDLLEAYGFVLPGNMFDSAPLLPSLSHAVHLVAALVHHHMEQPQVVGREEALYHGGSQQRGIKLAVQQEGTEGQKLLRVWGSAGAGAGAGAWLIDGGERSGEEEPERTTIPLHRLKRQLWRVAARAVEAVVREREEGGKFYSAAESGGPPFELMQRVRRVSEVEEIMGGVEERTEADKEGRVGVAVWARGLVEPNLIAALAAVYYYLHYRRGAISGRTGEAGREVGMGVAVWVRGLVEPNLIAALAAVFYHLQYQRGAFSGPCCDVLLPAAWKRWGFGCGTTAVCSTRQVRRTRRRGWARGLVEPNLIAALAAVFYYLQHGKGGALAVVPLLFAAPDRPPCSADQLSSLSGVGHPPAVLTSSAVYLGWAVSNSTCRFLSSPAPDMLPALQAAADTVRLLAQARLQQMPTSIEEDEAILRELERCKSGGKMGEGEGVKGGKLGKEGKKKLAQREAEAILTELERCGKREGKEEDGRRVGRRGEAEAEGAKEGEEVEERGDEEERRKREDEEVERGCEEWRTGGGGDGERGRSGAGGTLTGGRLTGGGSRRGKLRGGRLRGGRMGGEMMTAMGVRCRCAVLLPVLDEKLTAMQFRLSRKRVLQGVMTRLEAACPPTDSPVST